MTITNRSLASAGCPELSGQFAAKPCPANRDIFVSMAGFEFTLEVNAPIEVMWGVMTDHERWSDWMPSSKVVLGPEGSPDRNGIGAVRSFMAGKVAVAREEVIGWEPPGCSEEEKLGEKVEGAGGDASATADSKS